MSKIIDIEKIREGDPVAFKQFFESLYPKLKALACRFVDEEVAEDLVQEVFVSYWEQKRKIDADNIQSFLYKWLQNNCLNYIKHQMVVEDYEARVRIAEARIDFLNETSDDNEVFHQVINRDLREIIERSIEKLPPKCAQAFRLCYLHDVDRKEVAELMGISPRTVDGHIQQALVFLRKDLKYLFILMFLICTH